ncbi:MAG TPA: flagellar hook-length control protein FliK [Spongiibacteraceae bacterium]|nr:flagellar hook-length control protein FliK [Spongiibacteraceae bacterium]
MTPTSSSSSILLLNASVSNGKSAATTDGQATPGAGASGFELLLGAVQQLLSTQASGVAGKTDATGIEVASSGKALPQTGTTLPPSATEVVSGIQLAANLKLPAGTIDLGKKSDDAAPSGEETLSGEEISAALDGDIVGSAVTGDKLDAKAIDAKSPGVKKAKDQKTHGDDENKENTVAAAVVLPISAPPQSVVSDESQRIGNVASADGGAAPATPQVFASPIKGADQATRDVEADPDKINAAVQTNGDPRIKPTTVDSGRVSVAAASSASSGAVAADVKAIEGAKHENQSDFDALIKHLDTPVRNQPAVVASTADSSNVQQASRSYVNVAHDTAVVSTPVGSSGWSDAIADKVMWFSANKISSAEIHLNPPDLGPLQVRVSTQHDQASVAFTSQHAAVRDALDQALPRLREMMGSQGMHLLDVSVGGQNSQHQPQQQFARNDSANRDASFAGVFGDDSADATATNVTPVNAARLARAGVDAYA